jgi:hypothetical protein
MKWRLTALAVVIGAAGWLVPAAYPWYSTITASMDCAGTVTWSAAAWLGPTPASRENPDVRVWASYDGGTTYTQVGSGAFTAANGFGFDGTFSAGTAASVVVKVHEEADWPGDGGDVPGPPHYATATRPSGCTLPPTPPPPTPHFSRAGYCDTTGKFWNLIAGQDTVEPYARMHLRPADVNPQTGAIYCAPPAPPAEPDIAATPQTPPTAVPSTPQAEPKATPKKKTAKKVKAKHHVTHAKAKPHKAKKHEAKAARHVADARPPKRHLKHPKLLPFTL